MQDYGIWSIIPPLLTIILAITTRQVIVSLVVGVVLGFLVLSDFHVGAGLAASAQGVVDVFGSDGSAKVLIFIVMIGGVIHLARITRGMEGLIRLLTEHLRVVKGPISTQILAILLTALIFVESNISMLTSGIVTQPLVKQYRLSREKMAYIIRNTGLMVWSSVMINGWGAAMMGVIGTQIARGFIEGEPFAILARSMIYNFYAWVSFALVLVSIFTPLAFPGMRRANARAASGQELREGAVPMIDDEVPECLDCPARAINLVLPLAVMILTVPVGLYITGDGVMTRGSGSTSVLWGALMGQLVGYIQYVVVQRSMKMHQFFDELVNGYKSMMMLTVIMVLAFLIGNVAGDLNAGGYLASLMQGAVSPGLTAAIIFLLACIISLSTGTSWGTFSIMIPIGVQAAVAVGADPYLVIGAAISGSIFGDGVSPISDTGIVASMATASDLMDHINSQLPYLVLAALIALVFYVVAGFAL